MLAMVLGVSGVRTRVMRRFWDAHSRGWDDIRDDPKVHAHVIAVVDYFATVLSPGCAVVDVGCGPGHHAIALAQRGFEMTALDFSPAMLARARTRAREQSLQITFKNADLNEGLLLTEETFDGALCVGVLQMITDPLASLARVRRLLRPGGHLLVEMSRPGPYVPVDATPHHVTDSLLNRVKRAAARVPGLLRRYEPHEVAELFEATGLTSIETRTYEWSYTLLGQR